MADIRRWTALALIANASVVNSVMFCESHCKVQPTRKGKLLWPCLMTNLVYVAIVCFEVSCFSLIMKCTCIGPTGERVLQDPTILINMQFKSAS